MSQGAKRYSQAGAEARTSALPSWMLDASELNRPGELGAGPGELVKQVQHEFMKVAPVG